MTDFQTIRDVAHERGYSVQHHGLYFRFYPAGAQEIASEEFVILAAELLAMSPGRVRERVRREIARVERERRERKALLSALGLSEADISWSRGGRRDARREEGKERVKKRRNTAREKGIRRAARACGYRATYIGWDGVVFEPADEGDDLIRGLLSFEIHRGPGEWPERRWREEIRARAAERRKKLEVVQDGV